MKLTPQISLWVFLYHTALVTVTFFSHIYTLHLESHWDIAIGPEYKFKYDLIMYFYQVSSRVYELLAATNVSIFRPEENFCKCVVCRYFVVLSCIYFRVFSISPV